MKKVTSNQQSAKLNDLASKARAQFVSYLTILVLFGGMISGDLIQRVLAVTDTTNATQNVTSGVLTIDQVPNNLAFNAGQPGQSTLANIGNADSGGTRRIKVTSTLSTTFTLSAYFNTNWARNSAQTTQMAIASRMRWFPTTNGVVNDVSGGGDSEIGNVALGADANFAGIASGNKLTAASGSASSKGKYALSNLTFQYDIPISATTASDYETWIITELV